MEKPLARLPGGGGGGSLAIIFFSVTFRVRTFCPIFHGPEFDIGVCLCQHMLYRYMCMYIYIHSRLKRIITQKYTKFRYKVTLLISNIEHLFIIIIQFIIGNI